MNLCTRTSELCNILPKDIRHGEVRRSILSQKDNEASGNDNIPTGIFKRSVEIWGEPIKILIQCVTIQEMHGDWKWVIALIRKT